MARVASAPALWGFLRTLVASVSLGQQARNRRMISIAGASLTAQSCSLPVLTGRKGPAAEKAAQRFMSNEKVELEALRTGLYSATYSQAGACPFLVVAFDPTLLDFSTHNQKKDRLEIGNGKGRGYVWLNSAAIDPVSKRFLGVVHQSVVSAAGPDDTEVCDYRLDATKEEQMDKLKFNPKHQFLAHALCVHERAPASQVIVFVADREFDDGLTMRRLMNTTNRHFVIRGNRARMVHVRPADWLPAQRARPSSQRQLAPREAGLVDIALPELRSHLPMRPSRTIGVDGRGRVCDDLKHAVHHAQLQVGATAIRLATQSKRGRVAGMAEQPVWLNLVVVRESNPRPGHSPLEWLLLTDLPSSTTQELEQVVDIYACRWRIEEFFRTAKDVLKVEHSELDDAKSTARLLFFVTLKAMFLDSLREAAGITAGRPPTKEQRQGLISAEKEAMGIERARREEQTPPHALSDQQRAVMMLGHMARLGGWAAKSGKHLGNEVLTRGLPVFLHDVSEGRFAWLIPTDAPVQRVRTRRADVLG